MLSLDTAGELFALDEVLFTPFLAIADRLSEDQWEAFLIQADVLSDERAEFEETVLHQDGVVILIPDDEDFFFGCRVVGAAAVAVASKAHWSGSGGRTLSSVAVEHPPEYLTPAQLGEGADALTLAAWQGLFAAIGFPCPALGDVPTPVWFAGYEDDHVGLLTPDLATRVAAGLGRESVERAIVTLGIQGCEADDMRAAANFVAQAAAAGRWVLGAQAAT